MKGLQDDLILSDFICNVSSLPEPSWEAQSFWMLSSPSLCPYSGLPLCPCVPVLSTWTQALSCLLEVLVKSVCSADPNPSRCNYLEGADSWPTLLSQYKSSFIMSICLNPVSDLQVVWDLGVR